MSVDHTAETQINGLPGYNEMLRRLNKNRGFTGVWAELELFTVKDAKAFLESKLAQASKYQNEKKRTESLFEIALGFAALAVYADRENAEFLGGIARKTEEERIESILEEEQVNPPKDISW